MPSLEQKLLTLNPDSFCRSRRTVIFELLNIDFLWGKVSVSSHQQNTWLPESLPLSKGLKSNVTVWCYILLRGYLHKTQRAMSRKKITTERHHNQCPSVVTLSTPDLQTSDPQTLFEIVSVALLAVES